MNCVLFAKMDQVFSLKNKTLKNTGKVREFCQPGKVGTLMNSTCVIVTFLFSAAVTSEQWRR